ncbi:hypothetical protein [Vagococcus silagei]|uniref:LPXTG cell wall anchor domain-containing protein n=1 Tax=Vagococcus silagei TaxID=2508885 RepID=A0A4S3B387_9ENTE|nr:hypothetical protein [Vagococcus silagei]THB60697.1 hypothetical protein ESZ54_08885 [Vagococcus silagei]
MKRYIFLMCQSLVLIALFFQMNMIVSAEDLPPGMLIGDEEGITVDGTGAYYIQKGDLKPGDHFVKVIKLMNTEKNDRPYLLEMDVAPKVKTGKIDFYQAIQVTVKLNDRQIYKGNLIGEGEPNIKKNRLKLGTYAFGEMAVLEVTFDVTDKLPVEVWQTKSEAIIKWNFYATKMSPITPESTKFGEKPKKVLGFLRLPQTGEEWRGLFYKIITGVLIICVTLIFSRRYQDKQRQIGKR